MSKTSGGKGRAARKWPAKTLIEVLPVIIALTVFFTYATLRRTTDADLVVSPAILLRSVPVWVAALLGLVVVVGTLGIGWLVYLCSRAPFAPDGGDSTVVTVLVAMVALALLIIAGLAVTAMMSGPPGL